MDTKHDMRSFEDMYIDFRLAGYDVFESIRETLKVWTNGKFEQQPSWKQEEAVDEACAMLGVHLD